MKSFQIRFTYSLKILIKKGIFSHAIVDFQKLFIQNEQNNQTQTNSLTNPLLKTSTKYMVYVRMLTVNEIKSASTKSSSK